MRKFLRYIIIILAVGAITFIGNVNAALLPTTKVAVDTNSVMSRSEVKDEALRISAANNRNSQRSFFSSFRNFFPFRVNNSENDKLLSNVKIFPNPISEQINLSFSLGKQSSVSIKVMDALGNEVMTLLNQELEAGNQSHAFETNNKLTNGFYFIRVSAGAETVVKRISVL
ncbi:T9SS type A sorting domain-containing protein [Parapedobacter tibetensis]|uniref:T9SS type A sorting domain-containing protein n=1 Tax=Parapedobacter tibetensis TaxID=2972951 RepID=UPI00214DEEDB|nr:T9SS type A sorting domain-containing protein [Parapedobacter tibetensis]